MPVIERITLDTLTSTDLKSIEQNVVKLEELAQRKVRATDTIKNRKTRESGIFASTAGDEALPSNIIKKRRKLQDETSRSSDSILAGLDKAKDKKSAAAIVKKSEFTKLQTKVNAQGKILDVMSRGPALIQGASGLTTPGGILNTGLGGATGAIPGAALAVFAATLAYERIVAQNAAGGSRDIRKKVLDEDVSDIGVENENDIDSGRKLFLSNPLNNQGLPKGNSNTATLRDGIRIYNLRQEGTYS